jgi:HAD superfamily hydrolase (TIGR01490 family)
MNTLVLFDLDNTLLGGDSDVEWGRFLIAKGVRDEATHRQKNEHFYAQYEAGTLDIEAFLAYQLEPLTRYPRAQLDSWREEFLERHIRPLILPKALALIAQHQDQGALCAIVTATNSYITGPIARALGVEHLIATIAAWDGERFTGKARGQPAFREGKILRVDAWLESLGHYWEGFASTRFYSDSHNDLPLLARCSHPVATDPDSRLRALAAQRGWPIIGLREEPSS